MPPAMRNNARMVAVATAAFASAIPDGAEPPGEILLLPAGRIQTRVHDSRGPFEVRDPGAVVAATRALRLDLPIDYEHQSLHAPDNGQPAPAAGWIREVFAKGGEIWARVEWTDRGRDHLKAREYRYISAVFTHKRDGTVLQIRGAGLTNNPALEMPALMSANFQGETMDKKALAKLLGLAEDATEEQVTAALNAATAAVTSLEAITKAAGLDAGADAVKVIDRVTALAKDASDIRGAVGLATDATGEATLAAVRAKGSAGSNIDPSQFVPRAEFDRVQTQLNALTTNAAETAATAAVDDAIKAGKVAPASRDWALGYAKKDAEGFQAFVAAAPAILNPGRVTQDGKPPGSDEASLSAQAEENADVLARMGLTKEDFVKANKEA